MISLPGTQLSLAGSVLGPHPHPPSIRRSLLLPPSSFLLYMATLSRPRISLQAPEGDEQRQQRLLSLDIPTPFPRLPARTEQPQRRTAQAEEPLREEEPARQSNAANEQHSEVGERAAGEATGEPMMEAEGTDSVSQSPPQTTLGTPATRKLTIL